MPCGRRSFPSSRSSGPGSRPGGGTPIGGRRSTGSSSGCAPAASGSSSPASSAPRAPSTTGSSAGAKAGSCNGSGRCSSRTATSWAGSIGSGRAPTRRWARAGSGGKKTGKNPTDRGKMGTKKSVLVDGQGGPLGATIAGANVLERTMLRATIEAIVVERPEPTAAEPQHLSLDGGYGNPTARAAAGAGEKSRAINKGTE